MISAPLKVVFLGLALGFAASIACSNSSGGPGVISCKNPTPLQSACATCQAESCAAEESAALTVCASYVACYEGCDCADEGCLSVCAAGNTASCASARAAAGEACTVCDSVCDIVTVEVPTISTAPAGDVFPDGFTIGEACSGDIYVAATEGYLICYDGAWAYTSSDPDSLAGYTEFAGYGDDAGFFDAGDDTAFDAGDDTGFDAGDDSGSGDSGFDTGDDSGFDDGGADAETEDAGTDAG